MPGGKENVWCDRGPRCRSRSPRKKPSRTALKSLSLDLDKSIINTTFDIDWPAHDLGHEGVHVAAKRNDEQTKREDDEDEGGPSLNILAPRTAYYIKHPYLGPKASTLFDEASGQAIGKGGKGTSEAEDETDEMAASGDERSALPTEGQGDWAKARPSADGDLPNGVTCNNEPVAGDEAAGRPSTTPTLVDSSAPSSPERNTRGQDRQQHRNGLRQSHEQTARGHAPHSGAHSETTMRVRFAPWNVPLRRRLQTFAVLAHSLSILGLVSFFFFLCAIPLTWPVLVPYLVHCTLSQAHMDGRMRFRSDRLRRSRFWHLFAGYFPATLHRTAELLPTRKYILGYHPHGIISHGAFAAFATDALGFSKLFPGIDNSLCTLDNNFRIPFYRDYLLAMGLTSVSREGITNVLTRGGIDGEGMGRAVTIVVGGARESLEARPRTMRLILRERKGFVRLAIQTGADLVPVLAFGENDLYDQLGPESHPLIHRIQMFALRAWKFTLPCLHGRGIFNYDVGLMPYRTPLNIVVGRPILVEQADVPDPDVVDRLHAAYMAELRRLWDAGKAEFAPGSKEMEFLP